MVVERSETEGGTTAAEAAANTDPAALALQQQYQTEIAAALEAGDYPHALKLFKEFGNPNLRALNEVQTLKAFGDYAAAMGYDVSPESLGTDETLAAFEESYRNAIENAAKDGIIKSKDFDDVEENTFLSINKKQFGKKVGKHAVDFELDPSSETDRAKIMQIIQNIVSTATERRVGFWRGQQKDVFFYIKGEDVVVTTQNGEFVTILRGGINNERVKIAGKR